MPLSLPNSAPRRTSRESSPVRPGRVPQWTPRGRTAVLAALLVLIAAVVSGAFGVSANSASPGYGWLEHVKWMDAPAPAKDKLLGHVVVVEFWAADCINCRRTAPAMRELATTLKDSGVIVLGVHTPELEDEREAATVRRAMNDLGITWPVGRDDGYDAWRAFHNEYWPALYVLDGTGQVRARHIGELHVGTPEWSAWLHTISDLRARKP
jgi:thiol-disulfide isomerase/thioredoxin